MSFSETTEQQEIKSQEIKSEDKVPDVKPQEEKPGLTRGRNRPPEQLRLLSHMRRVKMETEGTGINRRMQRKLATENFDFEIRQQQLDPGVAFNEKRVLATPTLEEAGRVAAVTPTQTKLLLSLTAAKLRMENAVSQQDYAQATIELDEAVKAAEGLISAKKVVADRSMVQKERFDAIQPVLKKVKASYFNNPKSGSISIGKENLSPGTEFKAYMKSLESVEKWQTAKPPVDLDKAEQACVQLVKDAEAYLKHAEERYLSDTDQDLIDNHWDELPQEQQKALKKKQKPDAKALRKKQICEEGFKGARHLALAIQMEKLGTPDPEKPWSQEQDIAFNQLRAQFYFETGYKKASALGGEGGRNVAFWVESVEGTGSRPKAPKNFIFKPKEGEDPAFDGDYKKFGISAVKESLACANSKLIGEQTGIDLGVPETSVASIGGYAIEGGTPTELKTGSIQQFEKSDGMLMDQPDSLIGDISPEEWQRVSLNDIIGLNADRHAGNFLIKKGAGPNGTPKLVPIDHGNTLPSCSDFLSNADQFGGIIPGSGSIQNVTLTQPNAYEPYTPEMLKGLARLDPDALETNMTEHVSSLDKVNPGLNASGLLPDEAIKLSKRTTIFLKKAAPFLSPAEIMIAINKFSNQFADFNQDINELSASIIQQQVPLKEAYRETMTCPKATRAEVMRVLYDNGWDSCKLLTESPDIAWKLAIANVKNEPKGIDPKQTAKDADVVKGLLQNIARLLELADMSEGSVWEIVDKSRPDAQKSEQSRRELESAQPSEEEEAKQLFKQATLYSGERKQVICDFFIESSKKSYDSIIELTEGEDRKKLQESWSLAQQFYNMQSFKDLRKPWEDIERIANSINQRPVGPVTKKLDEAQDYVQSQIPGGERILQDATDRLTGLRDLAKQAVTAATAGNTGAVKRHVEAATLLAAAYAKAVEEARIWVGEVSRTFYAKLPRDNEMVPRLAATKKKLDTLFLKIQADVDGAAKLDKKVQAALAIVTDAADTTKNKDELLARVIEADQHSCFMLLSRAGAFESSASVDINSLKSALAAAGADNVSSEEKTRLVTICRGLMKDIVGKLNSLSEHLTKTKSATEDKLRSYPPQLNRNAPPFQKPFLEFDKVIRGRTDLESAHKELSGKAKALGQEVVKLI